MTTTRIKEKISALVSSQLPEFIQSDFPTFIAFIEAYYKFLEQDQGASELIQNARSYSDVDRTTNDFVEFFLNTYAKNIPRDVLINDRFLVKKIRDLYEAKGSELSFKLLFRILFDTDVEIKVPYDNVLRASGGNWQQNFSIRVETLSGNRNNLTNRSIKHTASGIVFTTPISRFKNLTPTLTEIFLDSEFLSSSYSLGDLVEVFQGSTLIFSGIITPTTTSSRIDQAGTGFKVGQVFNISAGGVGTLVKVTQVSSSGGLQKIKIINYGFGYTGIGGSNIFTVELSKDNIISQRQNSFVTQGGGYGSSGSIFNFDGNPANPNRYFQSNNYVNNNFYVTAANVTTFNFNTFTTSTTTAVDGSIDSNLAVIVFTLGALAVYPGSFISDQGFLSEFEVRLQDDQLYQPFAYQTNTVVDILSFVNIVKKLLNPAGQVLFNNRTIQQNLDLSSSLALDFDRKIFVNLHDSVKYFDFTSAEVNTFSDSIPAIDFNVEYNFNKIVSDLTSTTDDDVYNFNKQLTDNAPLNDADFVQSISKEFTDLTEESDNNSVSTNKLISDTVEPDEQITQILIFAQDYFEEDYTSNTEAFYVVTDIDNIINP